MAIFQAGRHRLHYEDVGGGRPIVLIHGFTNYGLSWTPQLAALVHAGYRVILLDLRGHGASTPAIALCTVPDLGSDLIELLDHLNISSAALCGLSLGGMVGLQLAIDHPDRVAALVVANTRASFSDPEAIALVDGWTSLFLQPDGPRKRLHATWPMLANEPFRESAAGRAAFEAWAKVTAEVEGSSLAFVARGMNQFDLRERLGQIRAPVLVISGEHDRLFSVEHGREIAQEIAGSSFATVPGAGHLSNLDTPDQFNRQLLGFLAANFPIQ
jgi:3-oxoadipate enol-lactonase